MYTNLTIDEHSKYKTYLAEGVIILSLIMVMIGTIFVEEKLRRSCPKNYDVIKNIDEKSGSNIIIFSD